METDEFIHILDAEGRALADAAEAAGVDAAVPTCPQWRVRELVEHTGAVHRWARAFVAEGHTGPRPFAPVPEAAGAAELLTWFREGHALLVDTLASAPADVDCFTFLPASSPLAFWARRQAHETAVHRVDAETAAGRPLTPLDAAFAADGIDEILRGFHARDRSKVRTDRPRVLRVRATDADDAVWTVRLTSRPPAAERTGAGDAECELSGPAADLYLALWNRAPFPQVDGDRSLAALWRETSAV